MMSSQLSPQDAASELLRRRKARADLLHFTNYTFPQYHADPAHALIAATLERVVSGDLTRLMIFAPPQHGKSELVSVRLPAYWLARRPDDPIIVASYAASLAEDKSRQARQIVESEAYHTLFAEIATAKDSRAVDHWKLAAPRRGYLKAVGVGGAVTGHGAMLGIVDDPFENWERAQSQTIRDRTWDWYRATYRTRIWERGAIVLIMTRWHEDDLAGRILADQGDLWHVLRLPAEAETQAERDASNQRLGLPLGQPDPLGRAPGAPLCPTRFSQRALADLRRDVGALAWAGEYQGVPRAPEGNRFKRSWFELVDALPAGCKLVRYWDKAGTQDGGAYTAGVLVARSGSTYYVVDVARGQWSAGERNKMMLQVAQLDASAYGNVVKIWTEQEPGSGGKESAEATVKLLAGFPVNAEPVTGSKDVRLEPFAAQAEAGNVKLLRGPWVGAWLEEITAIPNGRFRDQSDATGGAFNKLALAPKAVAGRVNFYGS